MTDYDGNNLDPSSWALNKALLRNTQLSQENARLRALVDGMTTEWGHQVWGGVFPCEDEETARIAAGLKPRGHVMSRRVSPWVVADAPNVEQIFPGEDWR